MDATTGQGKLTLTTSNTKLGASGTETLGVQFVNAKHALVIQFDGSATSSGSMDMQTLPSTLSGGYSFTVSGVDPDYFSVVAGGVFSISGTALQNGIVDTNNAGTVTPGTAFSGTISAPDSFGRGTITNTNIALTINYYIVGPEAIRIIDVDTTDSFVGSAFGQGATTFTNSNALLGTSVFGVESNPYAVWDASPYASAGMLTTVPDGGTFHGVADLDAVGAVYPDTTISGTYSISNSVNSITYNGYSNLTLTFATTSGESPEFLEGIYVTDPNLNLNDPNNTTGGGGALVADLSGSGYGTGVLVPQTDPSTASFAGNYAFGAQEYNDGNFGEFDFVGYGSVFGGGDFSGTGLLSDPGLFFGSNLTYSGVTFTGAHAADALNPGRYTMVAPNWLVITAVPGSPVNFTAVIYQASGDQLFWLNEDTDSLFLGSLQKQSATPSPLSAANAVATTKPKQ